MKILGIETSCDETAAALLQVTRNKLQDIRQRRIGPWPTSKFQIPNFNFQILSNVVASQVEIHKKYGGIVPEVAARQHVQTIIPVIQEALSAKGDKRKANGEMKPDLIAVTTGPGLITSLQVGVQTAKTLAYIWNVPLVGVNHLEAHLWSFLLNSKPEARNPKQIQNSNVKNSKLESQIINNKLRFPAVSLIVSGGHTELILVKGIGQYQLIGRTRDDAVGEALDKVAKMLNLGYPGGPIISHFAKNGNPDKNKFPRPMLTSKDFDFSFSGVKTAVKYYIQNFNHQLTKKDISDICAGFQQAVIEVLTEKTISAAQKFKAKSIILGGGVSANDKLISNFKIRISKLGIGFYYPEKSFTGDNAAMVALCGFFHLPKLKLRQASQKKASKNNWQKLMAEANLKIV